ncbi:MAG TPA: GNAT family N-acetyltransferase [Candidatus Acidoferrum sp.]|nr:GNAT family N-acetyltransferase [Candidatus Acidoferrum sp.]
MNIVCVDPRSDLLWRKLVEEASSGVFHSPDWIQVLTDTYGWEAHAYVILDDRGEPCAGIPFCRITDMLGERIVALPFSDYCDPIVNDANAWRNLVDQLLPEHLPITVRCLHNDLPLADERFALFKQAKWHGLDLQGESDVIWKGMHDSTQRAIRKSQREGLVVRPAQSEEELRVFFEMHLKVRKYKYGLLAQPYSFFQNIWRHFVEMQHGFILLALSEGKIVAGDFFLIYKDTLYYKFNASLPGDLSHRPNDLLIWEGIRVGKNRGLKLLDFGLSDIDQEGLVRYKRKFGTQEKTISFLRYEPNGGPTLAEKEMRILLGKLTNRFTDRLVPDHVTERAGEDLYRLFT